ncbi:MAG TPA: DnaJ domain-containing protein [Spirochaetota bacterium]|nr:DnaJ domain-containing protein [Spirochaetota bacterium]
MNHKNALEILELLNEYSIEDVKRNYRKLVFKHHPDRAHGATNEKITELNNKIILYNEAYDLLTNKTSDDNFSSMNFNWDAPWTVQCQYDYSFTLEDKQYFQMQKLQRICGELGTERKYGLKIRLYEIGINKCLNGDYIHSNKDYRLYQMGRDLGDLLFQLGLITDGIKFFQMVEANYYLGNAYFYYEDYENAIKYWSYEFSNPQTSADPDDMYEGLNLQIARAYFLSNQYEKCINTIEHLIESKIIQKKSFPPYDDKRPSYPKYFPQLLLYSIYILEGNKFLSEIDIKNKYHISYRFIIKLLENYKKAIDSMEKIVSDEKEYNKFIKRTKPKDTYKIKGDISLDYSIEELKSIYEKIFHEPYICELIQ